MAVYKEEAEAAQKQEEPSKQLTEIPICEDQFMWGNIADSQIAKDL